jgi:hypothetical protein
MIKTINIPILSRINSYCYLQALEKTHNGTFSNRFSQNLANLYSVLVLISKNKCIESVFYNLPLKTKAIYKKKKINDHHHLKKHIIMLRAQF